MSAHEFKKKESSEPASGREIFAIGVSSAILLSAIVYWVIQIQGVLELLRLAYG